MKTESLVRQERRDDPLAASRALQDLAPAHCTVVDARGKPVALSSAGYVLRPGTSYHVRLVPSCKDSELKEVRIISSPEFLTVDPELDVLDEEGQAIHSLPFHVKGDFWSQARKLGLDLRCTELQIAQYCPEGSERRFPVFKLPIVVRARWPILIGAILAGFIGSLLEKIITEMLWSGHAPTGGVRGALYRMVTDGGSWSWMVGLSVGAVLLVCGFNAWVLYRRSRELRHQFREAYPQSPSADSESRAE